MKDKLSFRAFSAHDLKRVAELERLCNPLPWTSEALQGFAEAPPSGRIGRLAILGETGEIAGYACVQSTGQEAEILLLGVAPEYRGRGMARALLLDFAAILGKQGCRSLFLEVRRSNQAAQSLYLSAGFTETGVRKRYYADNGEDARLMRWDLSR